MAPGEISINLAVTTNPHPASGMCYISAAEQLRIAQLCACHTDPKHVTSIKKMQYDHAMQTNQHSPAINPTIYAPHHYTKHLYVQAQVSMDAAQWAPTHYNSEIYSNHLMLLQHATSRWGSCSTGHSRAHFPLPAPQRTLSTPAQKPSRCSM